MNQPVLQTARLTLEAFRTSDLEEIFAYACDPEVAKNVLWNPHQSVEDSREYLNWINSKTNTDRDTIFFVWALREKLSGKVIGSIDFKKTYPHVGQFDYALARSHWNKALMSEAAIEVKRWALDTFSEIVRFQSFCFADNVGSRRVMEKAGLEFEGLQRKSMMVRGKIIDTAHYAFIR